MHGVLWIIDLLHAAALCSTDLLIDALEVWAADPTVFLPDDEIEARLGRLRAE